MSAASDQLASRAAEMVSMLSAADWKLETGNSPMTLNDHLDRLAGFDRIDSPVVSLYLNAQPNERGRDQFQSFVRRELRARAATYPPKSEHRQRLERDLERISRYLETIEPSANGMAIFACDAAGLFEAIQLDAPLDEHWLYIGDQPHLYPLARVAARYPRYAAVLAGTNHTRILVVAQGALENGTNLNGVKTRSTKQGGWSQARYQRHIENYHLHHVKDVVEALDKIVQKDGLDRIVLAGDAVVIPLLREQMPAHLASMVVDEISLPSTVGDEEAIAKTLESMQKHGAETDREKVDAAVNAYRAGGLGVVGPDATLLALTNGQVDELLLTASLPKLDPLSGSRAADLALANDAGVAKPAVKETAAGEAAQVPMGTVRLSEALVAKAHQTSARISFIEDPSLLDPYGGVAATLRYRI
jgi:peptide chain release factor subunit 1